jgi:hypothetical protein
MSSRPRRPMERVLGPALGDSRARCTRPMALCFISAARSPRLTRVGSGSTTARGLMPSSLWSGSACGRDFISPRKPAWRSIVVWSSMNTSKPARRAFSPPATLPAGLTPKAASPCASNTGSSPSGRAKPRPATCSGAANGIPPSHSSGASINGISIDYVGHAASWDTIDQDGDPAAHDVALRFHRSSATD